MKYLIFHLPLFLCASVRADICGRLAGAFSPTTPALSSLVSTSRKGFLDGGTNLPTVTVTVYGTATQYVGTWLLSASIVKDEELTAGEPARPTVIKTVYETTTVSTGTWYIATIGESSGSTSMTKMPLSEVTTARVSHDVMDAGNSPTSSSPFNYPTMSGMPNWSSTMAAVFPITTGITAEVTAVYRSTAEVSRPPSKLLSSNLYSRPNTMDSLPTLSSPVPASSSFVTGNTDATIYTLLLQKLHQLYIQS